MKSMKERLKVRMQRDRPMTAISLRIPEDVVEELKDIAPALGFSGYQPLIRSYIGHGLRRDLERLGRAGAIALMESLKRQGIADEVIAIAMADAGIRTYTGDVMENPFAIKAENYINSIIWDSRFRARAKNLGIGTPQLEVTNGEYATKNGCKYECFFVTLSEQDQLLSEVEQKEMFLRLLIEGAESLKLEENKQTFRQLSIIAR